MNYVDEQILKKQAISEAEMVEMVANEKNRRGRYNTCFPQIHNLHSTGIITSLVLNGGNVHGGLYLANSNSPIILNPSLPNHFFKFSTFSFTILSFAVPLNFTTPYFLSPSSTITTLSSNGFGASSAFVYFSGKINCIVTVFFSPSPVLVTTGAVMAISSDELVITGAVMAIVSGLEFWGLPNAPM
ncbi:hypothetical protein H5410_053450 [Solanum commersonii]|uniref:Uncharacterized protein n=1 Tax=Solanum commersonii TaxID=4109 RepID=A0A9J5X4X6_SOLCO|nr:hypothetical protein H5410_053450 [Solanum commersonii]